jgi:hypothetical protein
VDIGGDMALPGIGSPVGISDISGIMAVRYAVFILALMPAAQVVKQER